MEPIYWNQKYFLRTFTLLGNWLPQLVWLYWTNLRAQFFLSKSFDHQDESNSNVELIMLKKIWQDQEISANHRRRHLHRHRHRHHRRRHSRQLSQFKPKLFFTFNFSRCRFPGNDKLSRNGISTFSINSEFHFFNRHDFWAKAKLWHLRKIFQC